MQNTTISPRFKRRTAFYSSFYAVFVALLAALFMTSGCGGGGGGGGNNGTGNNGGASNTVSGVVRDSAASDTVVEGATVVIGGKTTTTTTTDGANANNQAGSFTLTDVTEGTDTATVTAPNGVAQTVRFTPPVAAGTNAPIELIINIGQISGRVLLANGQPAGGAFVTVASTADSVTADASGNFFIPNVPAGPTQLFLVLGTASKTQTVTVNLGNTDVGDITLIDDTSTTPPGIPNTLVGTITLDDPTGVVPAASANVVLFRNGVQLEATIADANGNYGFYVPAGNAYSVRASRAGFQDANSATVAITNPSVPLRVDLSLQP